MATVTSVQTSELHVDLGEHPDVFTFDFPIRGATVNDLVTERACAPPIKPELATPEEIRDISVYKRFADHAEKEAYRGQLCSKLEAKWTKLFGLEKSQEMVADFQDLALLLKRDGATIFGALLNTKDFEKLIARYTTILKESGSKSWIHTFVNLGNHPDFLVNREFNSAFLHPLLIAMVSYNIGGPIRMVDARGKDAEPISVLAQDNMLHIDNTPFNDEFKIITTWERGVASGPRGQNFVFLPGTHEGSRNCFVAIDPKTGEKKVFSTENASIFTTRAAIGEVFEFQKRARGVDPTVVEATHPEKPLTTVFAAGSLVHHRYRTEEGSPRSCIIVAFHRAKDNPGQLVGESHLEGVVEEGDLYRYLLGEHREGTEVNFLEALANECARMGETLEKLKLESDPAEVIAPKERTLNKKALSTWEKTATGAPTVEELKKREKDLVPLKARSLRREDLMSAVEKMMIFDKHGPLDLILYADSHEEIRKWGRNQIREMNLSELNARLMSWSPDQPTQEQLLTPSALQELAYELASIAEEKMEGETPIVLREGEKISRRDAFRSIRQLLLDLGESITRCEDRQAFLSTSLFLFWACDTLMRFEGETDPAVHAIGKRLLENYISSAILIEKQIREE